MVKATTLEGCAEHELSVLSPNSDPEATLYKQALRTEQRRGQGTGGDFYPLVLYEDIAS